MRCSLFVICASGVLVLAGCGESFDAASKNHARRAKRTTAGHDSKDMAAREGSSHVADSAGKEPASTDAAISKSESPAEEPLQPTPPQAGLLTAGSFDDHERLADYRQFVSQVSHSHRGGLMPDLRFGRRVMIRVVNAQGKPIGDARVRVSAQGNGRPLLDTKTGSDGRALLLTAIDGAANRDKFVVTASAPGQDNTTSRTMSLAQPDWRIELHDARSKLPRRLDLALVIDTTGSMRDELDYLKTEIDDIAATVHRMFPNVDQRYALIVYRDDGDAYVTRTYDFTSSIDEFRVSLGTQDARGGGDYPEAMHVALENAGRLSWRGDDTARVLFLVGDAPPHPYKMRQTFGAVDALRARQVRMFPVAASGAQATAELVMRAAAFRTLGQYLFLTDHSGVGNPHAAPHVPSYLVEKLNRLMIRMIASELAGTKLAPKQVLAIERGELDATRPPAIDPQQQPPDHQVSAVAGPRTSSADERRLNRTRLIVLGLVVVGVFLFDAAAGRVRRGSA